MGTEVIFGKTEKVVIPCLAYRSNSDLQFLFVMLDINNVWKCYIFDFIPTEQIFSSSDKIFKSFIAMLKHCPTNFIYYR